MLKKIYDKKEFIRGLVFGMILAITAINVYGVCNGEHIIAATITVITFATLNYLVAMIVIEPIFDIIWFKEYKKTGKDIEEDELV